MERMTQRELCYKMLRLGRSTVEFLNSPLCAEYRKWISIVRKEVQDKGGYVEKTVVTENPRNYYYKLIEKLTLYEIHCPTKRIQERAFVYYDNNGKVIDSRHYEFVRDWKKILPNTDMARLYWICCGKEEKQ